MVNKVKPYEKLVDYVKNHPQKGLTIPHANVEQIIGIPYRKTCYCLNSKYTNQVAKANERLTLMSLRLESIRGFGYRIINDNEYVSSMRKAYNMGVKNIRKAVTIANNTVVANLSPTELTEFQDVQKKINDVNYHMSIIPNPKTLTVNNNTTQP